MRPRATTWHAWARRAGVLASGFVAAIMGACDKTPTQPVGAPCSAEQSACADGEQYCYHGDPRFAPGVCSVSCSDGGLCSGTSVCVRTSASANAPQGPLGPYMCAAACASDIRCQALFGSYRCLGTTTFGGMDAGVCRLP